MSHDRDESSKLERLLDHIEQNVEHVLRDEAHLLDRAADMIHELRRRRHSHHHPPKTFPQVTAIAFSAVPARCL